jgi:hypothetical protein
MRHHSGGAHEGVKKGRSTPWSSVARYRFGSLFNHVELEGLPKLRQAAALQGMTENSREGISGEIPSL